MVNTTVEKLKKISFFSSMSDYDLRQIAVIITERRYDAGSVIIEERTEAERFFIVYQGKIEIYKRFEGGEKAVLSIQSDGAFFGEMAILDEGRRSATVSALEDTIVLEIVKDDFEQLLYKAPVLAYKILKELSMRLRETGALLISILTHRNHQLFRAYIDTMESIVQAIEQRNALISGYNHRATGLAIAIGKKLDLGEEDLLILELGTLLHDLGMLTVPDPLLEKSDPLNPIEYELIRTHPMRGVEMIKGVSMLERVIPAILHHHERFDGSGYPSGLSGTDIPLLSSIVAVADAFVAMTLDRPYRKRMGNEDAALEILKCEGTKFDPKVTGAFRDLFESGTIPV